MTLNNADWPFDTITLTAPDDSITAKFVSFGATLKELWVRDKFGGKRDVVLGHDDNKDLLNDPGHPAFNVIVGRYANRIKNGRFTLPDPTSNSGVKEFQLPRNLGENTLHGGMYGWDRRPWTIISLSATSVTYRHVDMADEGFPGIVIATVTHEIWDGGNLRTTIRASATEKTPIMLTQHNYWNLDAFKGQSESILDHHKLRVAAPYFIAVDDSALPTGPFDPVDKLSAYDFREERSIASRFKETTGLSGPDTPGYNHCWILDHSEEQVSKPRISFSSEASGIRLDITTDSPCVQIYSSYWLDAPRKEAHGGRTKRYGNCSALAIEQQGHLAAINMPEWGVDQIYGPGRDFIWTSTYSFSIDP